MVSYEDNMEAPYLWRRRNRENSVTGKAPISMRIEIDGFPRAEFQTGIRATEAEWISEAGRLRVVRGTSKEEARLTEEANNKLADWVQKARLAYHNYCSQGGNPSPADLREFLRSGRSKGVVQQTVESVFILLQEQMEQRGRSASTLRSLALSRQTVGLFLQQTKRSLKFPAADIDRAWCRSFERWCIARGLAPRSVRIHLSALLQALNLAVDEGVLPANKAAGYRYLSEPKTHEKRHLTLPELEHLHQHAFESRPLQRVADLFVFCCWTGLSYADYSRFAKAPATYLTQIDAVWGIAMHRQKMKTRAQQGGSFFVPLFPVASKLLDAYAQQLPRYDRSHVGKQLKLIAAALQLPLLDLSHKDARSTFAQMVRDRYGRELAAGMAGHSEQVADKHYSSLSPKRIVEQLKVLGAKLARN